MSLFLAENGNMNRDNWFRSIIPKQKEKNIKKKSPVENSKFIK